MHLGKKHIDNFWIPVATRKCWQVRPTDILFCMFSKYDINISSSYVITHFQWKGESYECVL